MSAPIHSVRDGVIPAITSVQVTEAHRKLATDLCRNATGSNRALHHVLKFAQLIADSEAKALSSLAMVTAESADRNVSLRLERDQLTDALDMMRDEFMRIIACPGCNAEIEDLANRAQLKLIQRVPVIVQRDRAEDEACRLRAELATERARLDRYSEILRIAANNAHDSGQPDSFEEYINAAMKEDVK